MDRLTNLAAFLLGREYAAQCSRLGEGELRVRSSEKAVAEPTGVPVEVLRHASKFARAVETITTNCGRKARDYILKNSIRAETVMAISRTHKERQRYEIKQVMQGRPAFAKPLPGVRPPFDTLGWSEVFNRLGRNAGLLDYVADGILGTRSSKPLPATRVEKAQRHLKAILKNCRSILSRMKTRVPRHKLQGPPTEWTPRTNPKPYCSSRFLSSIASVRGISEKNRRDTPRLLRQDPPSLSTQIKLEEGVERLVRSANRLLSILHSDRRDGRSVPTTVPGTYIVVFRLDRTKTIRIGRLGRFRFRAGFYAYLGSAFGGGGVYSRTNRHLTVRTARHWNVDHLKPHCRAVEVWWTHDRERVEFLWADILCSMPQGSIEALGFGGNDNKNAPAHLVRFKRKPSFCGFSIRVKRRLRGHSRIHRKAVTGWTGKGWPV